MNSSARKLELYEKTFESLKKIEGLILSSSNKNTLLKEILHETMEVVDAEAGSLFLYDEETSELYFAVAYGDKADSLLNLRIPIGKGIVGSCIKEKQSILVEDVSNDERFFKNIDKKSNYVTKSIISTPLYENEELLGAIEVLNKKDGSSFTSEDVQIMELIAHTAGIALKISNLIDEKVQFERKAAVADAISGISHYVKNILTGLLSSKSIIKNFMDQLDNPMAHKCWNILEKNINLISDLVQDMLSYSKFRKRTVSSTSVKMIINDIYDLYVVQFKNADKNLFMELPEALPMISCEETSTKRCFLNIISNALDAMSEKGTFLKIQAEQKDDQLIIDFEDDGSGIPADILEKIFNPFFSTKKNKGTGLGLAVTKKIIEENGGSISVKSEIDKGTTFTIVFPVADE